MANTIQHKRSSTSGAAPAASGLSQGELAINIADGKLYTKNNANTVINLGVTSISGTYITPSSGNFFDYLTVNGVPVSVSGHSHTAVQQAESLVTTVFNETGSTLSKMTAVYINGGHGDRPTIQKAIATSDATSAGTYGLVYADIDHSQEGQVIVFGSLSGVNTDPAHGGIAGATEGSVLYLSPTTSGAITTTKPYAPDHIVAIGTVVRVHQNEGIIEVRVQNGFELDELHNVAISGATNGQFLQYNSTNGLWVPSSSGNFSSLSVNNTGVSLSGHNHNGVYADIATGDPQTPSNSVVDRAYALYDLPNDWAALWIEDATVYAADNAIFDSFKSNMGLSNAVTGTGVANHIAYWNSSSGIVADSGQLVWDSTNNRLGIGTTSPSYTLDVSGTIGVSGIARFNNDIYMLDTTKRISWDNGTEYIGRQGDGIIIGTQSTTRILVNSAGNVGIGTESPAESLTVYGDSKYLYLQAQNNTGAAGIKFGNTAARQQMYIEGTSSDLVIDSMNGGVTESIRIGYNTGAVTINESGSDLDFRVEGDTDANLLFIDASADRVGIGTNTPGAKLDVGGSLRVIYDNPLLTINDSNSTNRFAGIELGTAGGNWYISNGSSTTTASADLFITRATDGTSPRFRFARDGGGGFGIYESSTSTETIFLSPSTSNSYINSSGNFGVGTASPSTKFHVSSTGNNSTTLEYTNSTAGFNSGVIPLKLLLTGSNGVAVGAGVGLDFVTKSSSTEYIGGRIQTNRTDASNNHALTFWAGGGTTTLTEYMRIGSNGNVGIGTTNPSVQLDVAGSGRFRGRCRVDNLTINTDTTTDNTAPYLATMLLGSDGASLSGGGLQITTNTNRDANKALLGLVNNKLKTLSGASTFAKTTFSSEYNADTSVNSTQTPNGNFVNILTLESGNLTLVNQNLYIKNSPAPTAYDNNAGTIINSQAYIYMQGASSGSPARFNNVYNYYSRGQFAASHSYTTNFVDFYAAPIVGQIVPSGGVTTRTALLIDYYDGNTAHITNPRGIWQLGSGVTNHLAGKVGIGTTSPNELLEVSGNLRLSDRSGSTGFKIQFNRGGGTANDYTIGKEGNHLAISTSNDNTTNRYTEFGYHAAGTWTPKTRLNNYTGALGVNLTATPSGSLDVGGDIYVRGAGTTGVMYFKSGTLADTTCKVRTDTVGNLYLDAGAYVRCGNQDGRVDMYASSQWITIGNTYDAGTANQYVRFVPANTEMMRVTKTGVGFGGVTSPLDRIHVSGTQTTIRLNNGLSYDTQLRMIDTASDWSVGINQGNSAGSGVFSIRSVTASSHRLVINPSGDIGIGTVSPTAKLDVRGSAVFNEDGANVDFRVEGDTDTNLLFVDASADKVGIGTNSPTQKLHIAGNLLVEDSGPYSVISATESEGFTIYGDGGFAGAGILFTDRTNGRIGIGTNAPNANLAISAGGAGGTIDGASQSQPFQINDATTSDYINLAHFNITNSSSRGSFTLSNNSSGAWENNVMQFFIHGDTYAHGYYGGNTNDAGCAMIVTQGSQISKLQIGNYGSAPIEFFTDNNFRVIIDSAGNVGIGTSSPSTKLQVDGFISQSANHITVGLTSDQTIPTGVDTVVQMTDKDDPNNWWDATTYRFSPTVAGYYYISAQVNWKSDSGTGQINSQLRRNGTTFCLTMTPQINSTGNTITHSLNGIVNMNGSTDYVDLTAYTSASDGSQLISGTADQAWTKLEAFKIS